MPAATPTTRHDGFTPERQRIFLESLAINGLVRLACTAADMSHEAAYRLRQRHEGTAFRLGWEAALVLARARLADTLMERAINGQEDVVTYDPDSHTRTRHRHDTRLALSLLARLDRFADETTPAQADTRLIAADWDAFLDLVASDHDGIGTTLFLAARRPQTGVAADCNGPCQLCGLEADDDDEDDRLDSFEVWEEDDGALRTNFPPPPGFTGHEGPRFGTYDYVRALSPEEDAIERAARIASREAYRQKIEYRRLQWFEGARKIAGLTQVTPDCKALAPR